MEEDDKFQTLKRYNDRLEQFGYSEEALGWSRNKNDVRFAALIAECHTELDNKSIGDFGCGFGDFYHYLKAIKGIQNFSYKGIDINENLINTGRKQYPEADFWVGDIVKDNFTQQFDFIFSSGVFNHKLLKRNEYEFIEETLVKINELSKKGFAVNFLSDKVDFELEHTFHSNPGKILEIAYKFSKNVVLRNDYMPFEFTVYVRKDVEVDSDKIVFKK